jgi:hypothetical protein
MPLFSPFHSLLASSYPGIHLHPQARSPHPSPLSYTELSFLPTPNPICPSTIQRLLLPPSIDPKSSVHGVHQQQPPLLPFPPHQRRHRRRRRPRVHLPPPQSFPPFILHPCQQRPPQRLLLPVISSPPDRAAAASSPPDKAGQEAPAGLPAPAHHRAHHRHLQLPRHGAGVHRLPGAALRLRSAARRAPAPPRRSTIPYAPLACQVPVPANKLLHAAASQLLHHHHHPGAKYCH